MFLLLDFPTVSTYVSHFSVTAVLLELQVDGVLDW